MTDLGLWVFVIESAYISFVGYIRQFRNMECTETFLLC